MTFDPTQLRQTWPRPSRLRPIVIIGAGDIVRDAHLPAYRKAGFPVAGVFDVRAATPADRPEITAMIREMIPGIDADARWRWLSTAAKSKLPVAPPYNLETLPTMRNRRAMMLSAVPLMAYALQSTAVAQSAGDRRSTRAARRRPRRRTRSPSRSRPAS